MDKLIVRYLSKIEHGELQEFNNMAVLPLFTSVNHGPEYLPMGKAMEKGFLTITEINDKGRVPELRVANKAEIRILLLQGEELAGAKQNRVLNTTILLRKNSDTVIPVSCVEQGRWAYASKTFKESGNILPPALRRMNISSVTESLQQTQTYRGNQGAIWNGIQHLSATANVQSQTGAMRDVFENREADLDGYLKAFKHVPHQKGILVMVNGMVMGFEIVSIAAAYETLHQKLIRSYAMSALFNRVPKYDGSSIEKAKSFIREAMLCSEKRYKSVGHGLDYRFSSDRMVGSSLVYRDAVIHLAFFKI
jgi:hypothetical protein